MQHGTRLNLDSPKTKQSVKKKTDGVFETTPNIPEHAKTWGIRGKSHEARFLDASGSFSRGAASSKPRSDTDDGISPVVVNLRDLVSGRIAPGADGLAFIVAVQRIVTQSGPPDLLRQTLENLCLQPKHFSPYMFGALMLDWTLHCNIFVD